jgi:hypothetical protein
MAKQKVQYNGKEVEGESIPFVPFKEPWAEYHLEGGDVLNFRATVTRVLRIPGEKNPDGSPVYFAISAIQVAVDIKDN